MSCAQVQAVSVLEDSRLDADGVLCPEVHDWIARVVTADDVIEALRRRPEVGRALAARLVIAGPWSRGISATARRQLWPPMPDGTTIPIASALPLMDCVEAAVHGGHQRRTEIRATRQQAHQWCDEQLLARGVVLLDELPGGER